MLRKTIKKKSDKNIGKIEDNKNIGKIEDNKNLISIIKGSKSAPIINATPENSYVTNEANMAKEVTEDLKSILRILEDKRISYDTGKKFNPITIAYMARWGTGKTSKMLRIREETIKSYNFITINLWKFSNQVKDVTGKEFVRAMVNDIFTQIAGVEIANKKNSTIHSEETKIEVTAKASANFFSFFKAEIEVGGEKTKVDLEKEISYVDEFLLFLNFIIDELNEKTGKPTIVVLDDLDRVELKNVKTILDSIISFLFIKNIVYIFPIDEKHVLQGIKEELNEKNPYDTLNKYFNYSIRSSFIPIMNKSDMFKNITENLDEKFKPSDEAGRALTEGAGSSYRALIDYTNTFLFNRRLVDENLRESTETKELIGPIHDEYIAFGVILQSLAPKLVDYLSEVPGRLKDLKKLTKMQKLFSDNNLISNDTNQILSIPEKNSFPQKSLIETLFWEKIMVKESEDEKTWKIPHERWELENIEKIIVQLNLLQLENKINDSNAIFGIWSAITLAKIKGPLAISFLKNKDTLEEFKAAAERGKNE